MYKIIGADGKEYGPVSVDQLKQWIAEGRLNQQSKVLPEGSTEWKTVAEVPELAASIAAPAAPLEGGFPTGQNASGAADKVAGPAIALMIIAGLALLLAILNLILTAAGVTMIPMANRGGASEAEQMQQIAGSLGGIVGGVLGCIIYAVVFVGALKMKGLKNYGLAMTASILAMLPCSPCCLAGLPLGIWALVVLNKPEVKAAFR